MQRIGGAIIYNILPDGDREKQRYGDRAAASENRFQASQAEIDICLNCPKKSCKRGYCELIKKRSKNV